MNRLPLSGLRVLVTRPHGQSEGLCLRLHQAGATVETLPLVAIEPLASAADRQRIREQLQQLPACRYAIFISRNAAEQALAALSDCQASWPDSVQAFAVGRSTAQWLQAQGIDCQYPEQMDSEGLLALPVWDQAAGEHCLVFRGQGGREVLAEGLRARGLHVQYCELYRRLRPDTAPAAWRAWRSAQAGQAAVVCLGSGETLDNLLAIDEHCPTYSEIVWLVPGKRVADRAARHGLSAVLVAPDATDDSLVDTLLHWYGPAGEPPDRTRTR